MRSKHVYANVSKLEVHIFVRQYYSLPTPECVCVWV